MAKGMCATSLLVIILNLFILTSSAMDAMTVVDLTYSLDPKAIGWPVHPPFKMEILQRGFNDASKLYLEWNKFNMGEHRGTHTDAPSHFVQGHWRNHEVPSSHLVGPGVVVDVRAKVRDNPVYKMTAEDLKAWEKENGRIPNGAVVLMSSGWGKRYPDPKQVFNTNNVTDPASYKFPSIHAAAAEFLANERNVTAVGVDVPSPDCADPAMPTHVTLLTKDILILENVANVDKLPPSGTTIVIGMIKINDGSGGPSRILALNGGDGLRHHASAVGVALVALLTLIVFRA